MRSAGPGGTRKLVQKLEEWPEAHRKLWLTGLEPRDLFDNCYAADLSGMTIRNARRGYGAWLHVQSAADSLDPAAPPAASITPANVRRFHKALKARGNTDNTVVTRFYDLQAALRIMQPECDFTWLTAPGGVSIRQQLQPVPKWKEAVSSAELLDWAHSLIETAPNRHRIDFRLTQIRDGLLIAMLTYLAPRLRSIAGLRIGTHLVTTHDGYRIVLRADDNKTRRERIDYPVPSDLTALLSYYLETIRPRLLGDARHDWLWVNANGTPLSQIGIDAMIRRRSTLYLGRTIGAHHFRHALATTAAENLPDFPELAARILAVSPKVVEGSYNRARQKQAIELYLNHVRSERSS